MVQTRLSLLAIGVSVIGSALGDESLQPLVTVVEKDPATMAAGSLNIPDVSPWCNGKPTYWPVGHEKDDMPSCLNDNGQWEKASNVVLDNPADRHDCAHLDVNGDGLPDVQCTLGAHEGKGFGYNELYITQKDGSLEKVPDGGGLQKYTTMRTRYVTTLTDANEDELLFIGVLGKNRTDGKPNTHRMFKNAGGYFNEVEGPWTKSFGEQAQCTVAADINQDGIDDLIVCNDNRFQAREKKPSIFTQNLDGTWNTVDLPNDLFTWRNVRVADFTADGIPDIAVAKSGFQGGLYIFRGTGTGIPPYFDFNDPHYKVDLPYGSPDLEILDVNDDGIWDIYVVQTKESWEADTYCARARHLFGPVWRWWGRDDPNYVAPPKDWEPPLDEANDVLFLGTEGNSFQKESMTHSHPGCGGKVEWFGDNRTMALFQGTFVHPGYHLLLQWNLTTPTPKKPKVSPKYKWINENVSFEKSLSGSPNEPGGARWNFRPVVGRPSGTTPPIEFLRDPTKALSREGTGYSIITLWEGAYFPPASVRMGQSVPLKKDYLYSVVVWARVNKGTTIAGTEGAVVSTFCEARNGEGFVGKDSTLNAIDSFEKGDYSRIQFDIVGNGKVWDCWIGLLGQPTSDSPPKEVEMYVDDFRVWEMKQITGIPPSKTDNMLADGGFDEDLSEIDYGVNGPEFNGDTPWHLNYNRNFPESNQPTIARNRLHMKFPKQRNILEFMGVFQEVDLQQGQKYMLQVDYKRKRPRYLPEGVDVSIFNYYVRMPDNGGPSQPHIRYTEGLLLGEVDVRVTNERSGTSCVIIVAPKTTTYEVVLKMSAYGNVDLGSYAMSFDNARLIPISDGETCSE